ncbi:MAG: hypothetical protein AUJ85_02905 [Elusimicrobia bacterium CG1_02_37_114]|nr:MAG: hypothetical protein AUJ85_02905 [Elusimicrobia bacterium CG1_02_37_114]PIV52689.1 MAG: transcriptional regulator [Elusimicrobia bacterium CG02_land_8_20_14_3_00_37_13]PIZ13022.1 MAG: transcriptional regulator [Elusimicrobia bacterium CG_4_10_14_0_8_um_filter_37_32]
MKKYITLKSILDKELKNPGFKKEFNKQEILIRTAINIAKLREKHHMTQKQFADKLHTSQQAVSRIEKGNYNPSLVTLESIAEAFHKRVVVRFV